MAVDGDDADSWKRHALTNPDLVVDVLFSLRQPRILLIPWQCRLDRDPAAAAGAPPPSEPSESESPDSEEADEKPSTSSPPPPPPQPAVELLDWGRRIKRSRMVKVAGIGEARVGAAAAAENGGRRRSSPQSPLEGCSSGSGSWASGDGEEGTSSQEKEAKRPRSSGGRASAAAVAVASVRGCGFLSKEEAIQRATAVLPPAAPELVKRPASKRATKEELHAVEKSLLEEKGKIQKELEELRRASEELKAANQEMQLSLELPRASITDAMVLDLVQLPGPPPPAPPSGNKKFMLPDLNEPPELDELPNC